MQMALSAAPSRHCKLAHPSRPQRYKVAELMASPLHVKEAQALTANPQAVFLHNLQMPAPADL
jgi:hypothetical protein